MQIKKKSLLRIASFGLLALSAFAVNPSAMAWGSYGAWATAGKTATCSAKAGPATFFDCTGSATASAKTLWAFTPTKQCGQRTQALGFPKLSNGNYVSVTANATDTTGTNTASTTAPFTLTHSICRCDFTIC